MTRTILALGSTMLLVLSACGGGATATAPAAPASETPASEAPADSESAPAASESAAAGAPCAPVRFDLRGVQRGAGRRVPR